MKLRPTLCSLLTLLAATMMFQLNTNAQQYKLKQSTSMSGVKTETTIYVKGPRKRTEGGGYMGMTNPTTIEQCDLQRTIKINDKKKLYFIEPFAKFDEDKEEVVKQATVKSQAPPQTADKLTKKGGTIYMYYNILDTGERKKFHGFTARRIWTTQKIKPSADACTMKDSMIIKTDGWYIDLPQFNCPVYGNAKPAMSSGGWQKPDCIDKYVSKQTGKGKLGFPVSEKRTMIMGGQSSTSDFSTDLETLELTTAKLDSMLFEIPLGYTQTMNEEDLQDKFDMSQMIKDATENNKGNSNMTSPQAAGVMKIAVLSPKGVDDLKHAYLQDYIVSILRNDRVQAVAASSEEDAKARGCELVLVTEFIKVKQGSKVGGLLKAISNTDPNAATSYNIEANMSVKAVTGNTTRLQKSVDGKFEGKADRAARKALDKLTQDVLDEL